MPQPAPTVPDLDEFGVLDLDELVGRTLPTFIQLQGAPVGYWFHPHWRGTTPAGEPFDITGPSQQIMSANMSIQFDIDRSQLENIAQGHAHYFYSIQPTDQFQYGQEESLRTLVLMGPRYFPGSGLNVAVIQQANGLQFNHEDLSRSPALVTVLPWQAMRSGDRLKVYWRGFNPAGREFAETREVAIGESEVGWPVESTISHSNISFIKGGFGLLSYDITYADGHVTRGPAQRFEIVPAATSRVSALSIAEHSGPTLDPALFHAGLTLRIPPYSGLAEGDVLVFFVEDVASGLHASLASVRLDLSSADSERLQCVISADWLADYLDRDIRLTYHVARPRHDLASEPLALTVRATMSLPLPVVQGASGIGEQTGEFKAADTGTGIKVWVPGLAVYPTTAGVEMHWEGFGTSGSEVVRVPTGDTPPAFLFSPRIVAPNVGKEVRIFYRVTVPGEAARDSAVFTLKILAIPSSGYPTLECVEANNGVLLLASLSAAGSNQKIAPWPLIAVGQQITLTVGGKLKTGPSTTRELLKNEAIDDSDVSGGISIKLAKSWLDNIQLNTDISFTVQVSADGGISQVYFPRVYIKIQQ